MFFPLRSAGISERNCGAMNFNEAPSAGITMKEVFLMETEDVNFYSLSSLLTLASSSGATDTCCERNIHFIFY